MQHRTTCRSLLFQGNSGWGKSSLVLSCCAQAKQGGHYAISIDARSALTPNFLLSTTHHVAKAFGDFGGAMPNPVRVGSTDAAVDALVEIGRQLQPLGRLLIIFFDQFENVFYEKAVLEKISQAVLRITDAQTNVVFGFAWKSDLVGLTGPFPYRLRDVITDASRTFQLGQFSDIETGALLDRLALDLRAKLRKDLRFLLAEFSKGYPWLLKKLCAHVRTLRDAGIVQAEIARGLLNVEDLFKDDLQGLSAAQLAGLHTIARCAPVSEGDLPDDVGAELLQSLIDRRLVVKVGVRYDIYWDIFRDYLNTGRLPVDEIYLLRAPIGGVLRVVHIMSMHHGGLSVGELRREANITEKVFFNLSKELRLLGLAQVESAHISSLLPLPGADDNALRTALMQHLKEKLPRNRSINAILREVTGTGALRVADLAVRLREQFPYISATSKTWDTYANITANWIDFTDLAILDKRNDTLLPYNSTRQIRERSLSFVKRRSQVSAPSIQFDPVVRIAQRVCDAVRNGVAVDWSGVKKSTIYKSLAMLEALGFISRRESMIALSPECESFARQSATRAQLTAPRALQMSAFKQFVDLLGSYGATMPQHNQIARDYVARLGIAWRVGTAETNIKIMLDWARHLHLAPGLLANARRGHFRRTDPVPLLDAMEKVPGRLPDDTTPKFTDHKR